MESWVDKFCKILAKQKEGTHTPAKISHKHYIIQQAINQITINNKLRKRQNKNSLLCCFPREGKTSAAFRIQKVGKTC